MNTRIGYSILEFPGQTHFFWQERQVLEELGIEADLVSTHPPAPVDSRYLADDV